MVGDVVDPSPKLLPPLRDSELENIPPITQEQWQQRVCELGVQEPTYEGFIAVLGDCLTSNGLRNIQRLGRARVSETVQARQMSTQGTVTPARWKIFVATKASRHIDELVGILGKPDQDSPRRQERALFLRTKLMRVPWKTLGISSAGDHLARDDLHFLRQELGRALQQARTQEAEDLSRWRCRIKESIRKRGKEVSKWIRQPLEPLTAVMSESGPVCQPGALLKEVWEAWNPVYSHSEGWSPEGLVPRGTGSATIELEPLSGENMLAAFRTKSGGASGAENLSVAVLRKLPLVAWHYVAQIFQMIEDGGEWPPDLLWIRVSVLPNLGPHLPPRLPRHALSLLSRS